MDGSEAFDQATNLGKPIPETRAIFAQGEGREPPSPSSSVRAPVQLTVHHDVIFLTNTSSGHCFLCLESPHDRQRTHSFHLVSWQMSCMCTKIGDASLRCSSFLPCRQALFAKGGGQVANCADEISKTTTVPERNAAVAGPAPSASAISSAACLCKTS